MPSVGSILDLSHRVFPHYDNSDFYCYGNGFLYQITSFFQIKSFIPVKVDICFQDAVNHSQVLRTATFFYGFIPGQGLYKFKQNFIEKLELPFDICERSPAIVVGDSLFVMNPQPPFFYYKYDNSMFTEARNIKLPQPIQDFSEAYPLQFGKNTIFCYKEDQYIIFLKNGDQFSSDLFFASDFFILTVNGELLDLLTDNVYQIDFEPRFFAFYDVQLEKSGLKIHPEFLKRAGVQNERFKILQRKMWDEIE
ncbi:Hypothetical_protein [Hexamita inflata]|uniref:Hypothetical_protein n=1 Tax=Hexamita inflata TaxID=28002 RepID=A0AA86QBI3_9EUKA|nr:Hypothetical protein HINF_LOCUS41576 [Hexamita inflata]